MKKNTLVNGQATGLSGAPHNKNPPVDPALTEVNELMRVTGLTRQAIQAMAKRERLAFQPVPQAFGPAKHFYLVNDLPERLRWLVGYFRLNPWNLRREGLAAYGTLVALREQIAKADMIIARLTAARNGFIAELEANGLSQ